MFENLSKKAAIVICAIICITLMQINAMYLGYNGALLTTSVGIIAGLAGLMTKTPKALEVN